MVVSSSVLLLFVAILRGTYGTIFPPVENPPPIPPEAIGNRNPFNLPEDLPELRDQRFSQSDTKSNEER